MSSLDQAISDYQAALDGLPQKGDSDAPSRIMALLVARDEVARVLAQGGPVSASATIRIATLDETLKSLAASIDCAAGSSALANWRQSIHPLESAWWWSLDERAAAAKPEHNPLWTIPAALLFVLSVGVLADTITTLKNGGLNRLSVFGTLTQSLLAILAGSTFLSAGRDWLAKLFSKLGINRKFQGASRVWLGAGMLALTLGISLLLPDVVARYRNRQGFQFFANKQYTDAVQSYQQAVALKPSFVVAHFNLALAYDKSHDYANAISEYERSIAFDPRNYVARNNLARLYILHLKDYNAALRQLNFLRTNLAKTPAGLEYYIYKNQGWAHLELKDYVGAEDALEWAIELPDRGKDDGAAARYLFGRVRHEQGKEAEARQQWTNFIRSLQNNPGLEDEVEPGWTVYAQQQLNNSSSNSSKAVQNEK